MCSKDCDENASRELLEILHERILEWGKNNARSYPWRQTRDPYRIFIAEVLLHRTNADQVRHVYERFVRRYPDFPAIVDAGRHEIRLALHSLGLTWRADLLFEAAIEIVHAHNGTIPLNKEKLVKLPGVGSYIASALLCFACDAPEPLLDTNTVRVVGRVLGLPVTDSSRRSKKFQDIMRTLAGMREPRAFFFSLIDFAAEICKARSPVCDRCPVASVCRYHTQATTNPLE